MIKLCIFDLDGTVLDTISSIAYYGNLTLEKYGIEPIDVKEYNFLAGCGMADLIRKMLNYRGCYSDGLWADVMRDYSNAYKANVSYKTTIFPGLRETLDAVKALGVKIAIVSNKPDVQAKTVVRELYGEGFFDFVSGQIPGGILKPDPTVVLSVMESFGATRDECLYIGDTSTDMHTGKNAGMYTVGVLWGFRGRDELTENGADILLERPEEIYDLVVSKR